MTSYINRDQFNKLYDSIVEINGQITFHSEAVDELENKLIKVQTKRKEKNKERLAGELNEDDEDDASSSGKESIGNMDLMKLPKEE